MAQPHKGKRHSIKFTLDSMTRKEIYCRATELQLSVSQFLADHLALHVGRPDLVYALGQDTLKVGAPLPEVPPRSPYTFVRCHEEVHAQLVTRAREQCKLSSYVAGFCRELVGGIPQTQPVGYQEVLATSA